MGKQYPIVFIGETGSGKSTAVNAWANYLKYNDYNEAVKQNKPEVINSVSFGVPGKSVNTPNKVTLPGKAYTEGNENFSTTVSSTQKPMQHVLDLGDGDELLIVDTPGLGDPRGFKVDAKHMNNIINILAQLEEVYAIIFFIPAYENKLTPVVKYVIATLLSCWHKNAADNIFFVFTNTYSNDFTPCETYKVLEGFLNFYPSLKQKLLDENSNRFCIDNIGFRGQCIKYKFPEIYIQDRCLQSYKSSWNTSKKKMTEMLDAIKRCKPHKIAESISISQASDVIMLLSEPLAITTVLHNYKTALNNDWIGTLNGAKKYLQTYDIEYRTLEQPRTVCASEECMDVSFVNGRYVICYKTVCHDLCEFPESELQDCKAFGEDGLCKKCGCSWEKHIHTDYEQVPKLVENRIIYRLQKASNLPKAQGRQELDKFYSDLEKEQKFINSNMVKFGAYLKNNALLQDLSYFASCLKTEIENAELLAKLLRNKKYVEQVCLLKASLKQQEKRRDILETVLNNVSINTVAPTEITVYDITSLRRRLFKLNIMGDKIKDIYTKRYKNSLR